MSNTKIPDFPVSENFLGAFGDISMWLRVSCCSLRLLKSRKNVEVGINSIFGVTLPEVSLGNATDYVGFTLFDSFKPHIPHPLNKMNVCINEIKFIQLNMFMTSIRNT